MSSVFGDMFLVAEANDDMHAFYYDNRFTWMYTQGQIKYWSVEGLDDGFPSLKRTFPFELKARFQSPWFMVTFGVGFRMFSSQVDQPLPIEYVRSVDTNEGYADSVNFDNYRLRVTGFCLPITAYYNMTEGRGVDAGLYIGVGPFFANALYEKTWTEGFESIINGDRTTIAPTISRAFRMEGRGWGIMFEAGTRLDFNISRPFALFIEAGYAYHVVFSLSGESREVNGSTVETWDGKWMIRNEDLDRGLGYRRNGDRADRQPADGRGGRQVLGNIQPERLWRGRQARLFDSILVLLSRPPAGLTRTDAFDKMTGGSTGPDEAGNSEEVL